MVDFSWWKKLAKLLSTIKHLELSDSCDRLVLVQQTRVFQSTSNFKFWATPLIQYISFFFSFFLQFFQSDVFSANWNHSFHPLSAPTLYDFFLLSLTRHGEVRSSTLKGLTSRGALRVVPPCWLALVSSLLRERADARALLELMKVVKSYWNAKDAWLLKKDFLWWSRMLLVFESGAVAKGYRLICWVSTHLLWELMAIGCFWIRGKNNFALTGINANAMRRMLGVKRACRFLTGWAPERTALSD